MNGKLSINPNGNDIVSGWTIKLDDVDISNYVSRVLIDATAGSVSRITIDVIALPDIPTEIRGEIEIYLIKLEEE